jgi:hypothetical protein
MLFGDAGDHIAISGVAKLEKQKETIKYAMISCSALYPKYRGRNVG